MREHDTLRRRPVGVNAHLNIKRSPLVSPSSCAVLPTYSMRADGRSVCNRSLPRARSAFGSCGDIGEEDRLTHLGIAQHPVDGTGRVNHVTHLQFVSACDLPVAHPPSVRHSKAHVRPQRELHGDSAPPPRAATCLPRSRRRLPDDFVRLSSELWRTRFSTDSNTIYRHIQTEGCSAVITERGGATRIRCTLK